jgi:hypothetical protein
MRRNAARLGKKKNRKRTYIFSITILTKLTGLENDLLEGKGSRVNEDVKVCSENCKSKLSV